MERDQFLHTHTFQQAPEMPALVAASLHARDGELNTTLSDETALPRQGNDAFRLWLLACIQRLMTVDFPATDGLVVQRGDWNGCADADDGV